MCAPFVRRTEIPLPLDSCSSTTVRKCKVIPLDTLEGSADHVAAPSTDPLSIPEPALKDLAFLAAPVAIASPPPTVSADTPAFSHSPHLNHGMSHTTHVTGGVTITTTRLRPRTQHACSIPSMHPAAVLEGTDAPVTCCDPLRPPRQPAVSPSPPPVRSRHSPARTMSARQLAPQHPAHYA